MARGLKSKFAGEKTINGVLGAIEIEMEWPPFAQLHLRRPLNVDTVDR